MEAFLFPNQEALEPPPVEGFFIVVQIQLSAFSPAHTSHPHLPPLIPPPFGFVHVSFIHVPENPSPFTP